MVQGIYHTQNMGMWLNKINTLFCFGEFADYL